MQILMTRHFAKWSKKQKVSTEKIINAVQEVDLGKIDADLGSFLIKKRVQINHRSKRAGARVIMYYKRRDKAIFTHGFMKSEKSNLSSNEQVAFKALAKIFSRMTDEQLTQSIKNGDFVEV